MEFELRVISTLSKDVPSGLFFVLAIVQLGLGIPTHHGLRGMRVLRAAHFGTVSEIRSIEDVSTPACNDLVHQPYKVRLAISFLVLLGKGLDCLVDEVTQVLRGVTDLVFVLYITDVHTFHGTVMQDLKEFPDVFLTFRFGIRLVKEL